jgi:hypothetical protein
MKALEQVGASVDIANGVDSLTVGHARPRPGALDAPPDQVSKIP